MVCSVAQSVAQSVDTTFTGSRGLYSLVRSNSKNNLAAAENVVEVDQADWLSKVVDDHK